MSIWEEKEWKWQDRRSGMVRFMPQRSLVTVAYRPVDATEAARASIEASVSAPSIRTGTLDGWRFVARAFDAASGEQALLESVARTKNGRTLPVVTGQQGETRYFIPGRVSVQLEEGEPQDGLDRLAAELAGQVVYRSRVAAGFGHIALPVDAIEPEVVARLNQDSRVRVASLPEFGLGILAAAVGGTKCKPWGVGRVRAKKAKVTGNAEVVVGIVDSGVDLTHPQLRPRLVPPVPGEDRDFLDPADVSPHTLEDGHGTHVAGIVAAVAPQCRLLPVQVGLLENGQDTAYKEALMLLAGRAAAGARMVVNMSFDLGGAEPPQVKDAVAQAHRAGALLIAAAGNRTQEIGTTRKSFPASFPEVAAIAATNPDDEKIARSNFGIPIAASAPGANIRSTVPGGGTGCMSGTSMAAPHAAGVAALIWRQHGHLAAAGVLARLRSGCDDIRARNDPALAGKLGAGRLNAQRSV